MEFQKWSQHAKRGREEKICQKVIWREPVTPEGSSTSPSIVCLQEAILSASHLNWFKLCFSNFYLKNPVLAKPSGRIFLKEVKLHRYYWNGLVSFQGDSEEFSSVMQSCPTLCNPMTAAHQASWSVINSWSLLKLMSIESVMPSSWCSSSVGPFSSHLQTFSASRSFQMSQFSVSGGQIIGVSASASVLPVNTQDWSPCSPRDSQESSPTPQFKSINSSALSFLYSPTLTCIHDYWKNHSLD